MHLDRIHLGCGKQLLKICEHIAGDLASAGFIEQQAAFLLMQRGVATQDVVLGMVAGLVANDPVGHDEIGE